MEYIPREMVSRSSKPTQWVSFDLKSTVGKNLLSGHPRYESMKVRILQFQYLGKDSPYDAIVEIEEL